MDGFEDLPGLRAFERVAALGSLTAAATELGISLAAVSKRLAGFERRLGVRLLHRSTRRLSMTDEGRLLYPHAVQVVSGVQRAREAITQQRDAVSGVLRLTAPNSFGRRYLLPLLAEFEAQYPHLRLHLQLSDDVLDLVASGFDVAIRYGELSDSRLVARTLAENRRVLCASPAYLARRGVPQRLADLARHDCIVIGTAPVAEWRFDHGAQMRSVRVEGHIVCNDGEAAHAMALQGMGIVMKSVLDVAADLDEGRLVQILPRLALSAAPLSLIYTHSQHLAPRVRAFVDFLVERLTPILGAQRGKKAAVPRGE